MNTLLDRMTPQSLMVRFKQSMRTQDDALSLWRGELRKRIQTYGITVPHVCSDEVILGLFRHLTNKYKDEPIPLDRIELEIYNFFDEDLFKL